MLQRLNAKLQTSLVDIGDEHSNAIRDAVVLWSGDGKGDELRSGDGHVLRQHECLPRKAALNQVIAIESHI